MVVSLFTVGDNIGGNNIVTEDTIVNLPKVPFSITFEYKEVVGVCTDIRYENCVCIADVEIDDNLFFIGYLHDKQESELTINLTNVVIIKDKKVKKSGGDNS